MANQKDGRLRYSCFVAKLTSQSSISHHFHCHPERSRRIWYTKKKVNLHFARHTYITQFEKVIARRPKADAAISKTSFLDNPTLVTLDFVGGALHTVSL